MATKRSKKRSKLETLSKFDIFGHPISLNFNGHGSTFKTDSGGVLTLIVVFGLLGYFTSMIVELVVNHHPQYINSYTTMINLEKQHSHSMIDSKFMPYFTFH